MKKVAGNIRLPAASSSGNHAPWAAPSHRDSWAIPHCSCGDCGSSRRTSSSAPRTSPTWPSPPGRRADLDVPYAVDLYDNFESFGQARIPGMVGALRRAVRRARLVTTTSEPLKDLVVEGYHATGEVISMPSTVDKRHLPSPGAQCQPPRPRPAGGCRTRGHRRRLASGQGRGRAVWRLACYRQTTSAGASGVGGSLRSRLSATSRMRASITWASYPMHAQRSFSRRSMWE